MRINRRDCLNICTAAIGGECRAFFRPSSYRNNNTREGGGERELHKDKENKNGNGERERVECTYRRDDTVFLPTYNISLTLQNSVARSNYSEVIMCRGVFHLTHECHTHSSLIHLVPFRPSILCYGALKIVN